MDQVVFTYNNLTVLQRGESYFVRYDAGAHQEVWREDEISREEALQIQVGPGEATEVILELQRRLTANGIDPYVSNYRNA